MFFLGKGSFLAPLFNEPAQSCDLDARSGIPLAQKPPREKINIPDGRLLAAPVPYTQSRFAHKKSGKNPKMPRQ